MIELRPYQEEAISAARECFKRGAKRLLLTCPTGGGKTVVASSIIRSAEQLGSRVVFLAHRRELLQQTSEKLARFGVHHGLVQAGVQMKLGARVQVASVQTLVNRLDVIQPPDLLVIDEAHHSTAGSYQTLLNHFSRARVIGLTATPWRLDGKGLGELFDTHVNATTPFELHSQGFLAPVRCFTFRPVETEGIAVTGGDFNAGALTTRALERAIVGDVVRQYIDNCTGKRAVLFARTIAHSKAMVEAFQSAGVPAEHIDGNLEPKLRDGVLARLREGRTHVLCNVNVCTEGWDLPELEVCILARPTLSEALYLQMVGRALRTHPSKQFARVHDHARLLPAFGHPYDDRDWTPKREARKKRGDVEQRRVVQGAEVVRRGIEEVQAAQAEEVHRGGIKESTKARPFFPRMSEEEKHRWYLLMAVKHGARKACGVYRWASGEKEWPKRQWREEAEAGQAAAQ